MAKKSKRDDLAAAKTSKPKPIPADIGRQPRIVGWLVLIVGGFSSWYWYRPLPETVHQTVHATSPSSWATSKSGPNSLWTDQTLVLPSTDETINTKYESPAELSSRPNEDSQLVGSPKVTLVPWNDTRLDIRDVLKTERFPMVPITPNFDREPMTASPQTWTPDQQLSNRVGGSSDFKPKPNWPDSDYVPPQKIQKEQRRATTQITTQIPKLLETGMKSIRTDESESQADAGLPKHPPQVDGAFQTPQLAPQPSRQPQFIRQPRSSN